MKKSLSNVFPGMVILVSVFLTGFFVSGAEIEKDPVKEFELLKQAAESGDIKAQYELALRYYRHQAPQKEIAQNQQAAAPGVLPQLGPQPGLAGAGQIRDLPDFAPTINKTPNKNIKDLEEAAKWFTRAAEKNHPDALYRLGLLHIQGQGIIRDVEEGISLIRKAAELGHADAQFFLGIKHYHGNIVKKDYKEAAKWLTILAENGVLEAQRMLGTMYSEGLGVERDLIKAHALLNIAAAKGEIFAGQALLQVESQMTSDEISKAKKLARDLMAKINWN